MLEPRTQTPSYNEVTRDIHVRATPFYISEKSSPEDDYFFFAYKIEITNNSDEKVKLLNRHWIIRDGKKVEKFINGEGVIGQRPEIEPNESFEYTSFCPLSTPTGNMRGKFELQYDNGDRFWVRVPLFFFRRPESFITLQ
ncbi:MAG: Co2+/Mg2+ efflux protein ApaG [Oligoflexia bacterium]|nr:Co2+/Mg2+ efflux protein ApaG [Oligoflexia bacterium]